MFYKGLTISLYIFLISLPAVGSADSWNVRKTAYGQPVYYSKEGNGYYRKISQSELADRNFPKTYIVADNSGYYYHYENEEGGGGYYSYEIPYEIEEYYRTNEQIGHIVLFKEVKATDCNCNKNTKTAKSGKQADISSVYPIYFDD